MTANRRPTQFHAVIPVGTKVVSNRDERVGVVTGAEGEHYEVRFPDGTASALDRAELTIFRQAQGALPGFPAQTALYPFVIYRCVVGSTAYGLAQEGSDVDRRGFYLPPADLHWSLAGLPEQLETDREEVYWEIEKFI